MRFLIETKFLAGFLLIITVLFAAYLHAQTPQKAYKKGVKYFEIGNYVKALESFEYLSDSSGSYTNEVATYMAQCHLELFAPNTALQILESVGQPDDINLFLRAESSYYSEQFDQAVHYANQVIDTSYFDINELKSRIDYSSHNYDQSEGVVVQNFGENINSVAREYSVVMFNDYNKLLFTSRGQDYKSTDVDGLDYENISFTQIDSLDNWMDAKPLQMGLEQVKTHDATVQVYDQGNKLISYHDGDLYTSSLEKDVWHKVGKLKVHDYEGSDTHCHISNDENSIFFASDFQLPSGDLDLYFCTKDEQNKWTTPKPIHELNTSFDEDAPFLSNDGTLYFSSRGHNSMGGYDVFKSEYDSATEKWSPPINLGYPINTVSEDIYYTTQGKLGYISSSRAGGFGSLDLYRILLFNKVKITGYVIDKETNQPIPDIQIDLEYDSLYFRSYTDINGKYEMFVPINKEMKVSFIKDSTNIYEDTYLVNVYFKDKNNNEYNFHISDNHEHPSAVANFQTYHTVKNLKIDVNNNLSSNPNTLAIPTYQDKQWVDSTARANDKLRIAYRDAINRTAPSLDTVQLNIYFKTGSYMISENDKKLLDAFAKKQVAGRIRIGGYTDNSGNKNQNIKLSILRARTVYDYLNSMGVATEQMIYKGYGPLLPDSRNKQNIENQYLRRTEIIYHE